MNARGPIGQSCWCSNGFQRFNGRTVPE
jgi:hypothetical protein